ncbi:cobalt ABC transporter permease (plasmid) [Cereibacter azotoformans]|uniref:cobalt ABC transporter permease n=1 Tax=Cereibacter azotoformans TaxID=43057 RepID=UPI001EEC22E8|nr:cobalt ABC transporter permease [Cereibacter azotoformans]ULB12382.1 cobalt ABC transporter permease [Cereibacter azotoformans]
MKLLLALVLVLAPLPAFAHKVIASVYPAGAAIEGEIGFSNGDMAANQRVTVTDPEGRPLGEVVTDAAGAFSFTPAEPIAHVFHANLGAGHVAEVTMPAEAVAALLGKATPATPPGAGAIPLTTAALAGGAAPLSRDEVAAMLRDELRPLRQEIAAYKEKNDLQTILGGLGWIAGLFGLGFYLAARRRMAG